MSTAPILSDEAVDRVGLRDTPPEERFDRITRMAQELFDVDIAVVNVVDSRTTYTKSQGSGAAIGHTPIEDSFCQAAVKQHDVLEVPDATEDPRFAHLPSVENDGIRFYAGYPLRTDAGETVGTICIVDTEPRTLDDTDREAFQRLGQWAEAEMRLDDPATDAAGADEHGASALLHDELHGGEVRLASLAIPYHRLSGDRSAWQQVGDRIIVTLTDIMGKGEIASGFAQTLVEHLHARAGMTPVDALREVEVEAGRDPRYRGTFATLFHAAIDTITGRVEFVDAGHGLTLLLRSDGTTERLHSTNLPLGLRPRDIDWEPGETTVAPGDLIVSVSDGALDAYDSTLDSLRMIGEDLRRAPGPDGFFNELSVRVTEHVVDDDVTAVVVSIH
jgi:hypothetical protein